MGAGQFWRKRTIMFVTNKFKISVTRKRLSIFVLSTILLISFYLIPVSPFLGKFLLDVYGGFSIYHISRIVTKGERDQILNQEAILEYIYQNVTAEVDDNIYPVIDHSPIDLLIRGVGWCDQVAHLFVKLLEPLDILGFGLVLTRAGDKWVSPHTVAVVVPKGLSEEAYREMHPNYGSWRIEGRTPSSLEGMQVGGVVDPSFGILIKNPNNQPATINDLCTQNIHSSQINFVKNLNRMIGEEVYCNQVEIWWANNPISEFKGWRKWAYKYIYPILPTGVIHLFQDLVLMKGYVPIYKGPSFAYFKARNYHLYERFDEAIENYNEAIAKTSDYKTLVESSFWKGMIYFNKKEFDKASKIFKFIIKNHPKSGLASAAKRWLLRITMNKKRSLGGHSGPLPYYDVYFSENFKVRESINR